MAEFNTEDVIAAANRRILQLTQKFTLNVNGYLFSCQPVENGPDEMIIKVLPLPGKTNPVQIRMTRNDFDKALHLK